jgi:RHH-type rel operon transcriptional repressor/antitoxin RelB
MLAVRLSDDLEQRLTALSKRTNRSKSFYVKKALQAFLENEEDYALAEEAYAEYLRSGKKGYTAEQIKEMYDLD